MLHLWRFAPISGSRYRPSSICRQNCPIQRSRHSAAFTIEARRVCRTSLRLPPILRSCMGPIRGFCPRRGFLEACHFPSPCLRILCAALCVLFSGFCVLLSFISVIAAFCRRFLHGSLARELPPASLFLRFSWMFSTFHVSPPRLARNCKNRRQSRRESANSSFWVARLAGAL